MRTRPVTALESSYTLLRCSSCFHVWLFNPPSPEQLLPFYDLVYYQAVSRSGEGDTLRWIRLVKIIERYKIEGAILDIGCSSGGFLSCIKSSKWELAGIELNAEAAEKARQNTGGQIMTGDIANVQFPPNAFDVVTCYDVLEHLHEPRVAFEKVAQWLKPNGIFYIFVPNVMSWEARLFKSFWYPLDLPRHLHFFSPSSLNSLASFVGLRTSEIATPPGNYLEHNTSRLLTYLAYKATGFSATVDISGQANILWRIARKGFRLSVENGFGLVASICHGGPSLQAVFQKAT